MLSFLTELASMPIVQSLSFGGLGKAGLVVGLVVVVFFFICFMVYLNRYVKAGPNQVLVVSGRKHRFRTPDGQTITRGFKVVKGGGVFVWPIIEKFDVMSLEIMTIDVRTPEVYTKQGVPILVDGIAQIKIKGDDFSVGTAAEQFLSKGINEIQRIAQQTLEGHMRAIMGTLSVEDVYSNRDAFAQKVAEVAATDLNHMGLAIISFTIRDVRDNVGYLDSLGKARTAQVKRDAQIGEAEATRDSNIAIAEAQRDSTIRSAQAQQAGEIAKLGAQTKIAEANRDYEMNVADYKRASNQKQAEADLAYELQKNTTMQKVKEQEIEVQVIEKTKQIDVQEKEIARKQKELEAMVYKPAEAEKYRIQMLADAEQYKLTQVAQGAAEAEKKRGFAAADVVKAAGDAEGSAIKAKGLSQAEVIQQTGLSEAIAMEKKAAAWKEYNEAAILTLLLEKFPEIASAISAPLSKVDKIVMISSGDGGGTGASKLTKEVTDIAAQLPAVLEAITGVDFKELLRRVPELTRGEGGKPAK